MTTGNPTLRKGMESEDGWVEYLHGRLSEYFWGRDDVKYYNDGGSRFDDDTEKAVEKFQGEHHLKVDGVVGDQTWAALNGDPQREDVGTDGYPAGTFVERGKELRFNPGGSTGYASGSDTLILQVWNVGTEQVQPDEVTSLAVHVKMPDGTSREPTKLTQVNGSGWFELWVEEVTGEGPDGRYSALIQLPMEFGGDTMQYEFDRG
jgi:hypothetical protein